MIVKVHWSEHVFSVVLANNADYAQLYEKVAKKIRMIRGNSGPDLVHIKWVDADNDEVSLRCDADIEAMFDEARELGATYVNLVAR
jgi:cell division control protein 24